MESFFIYVNYIGYNELSYLSAYFIKLYTDSYTTQTNNTFTDIFYFFVNGIEHLSLLKRVCK